MKTKSISVFDLFKVLLIGLELQEISAVKVFVCFCFKTLRANPLSGNLNVHTWFSRWEQTLAKWKVGKTAKKNPKNKPRINKSPKSLKKKKKFHILFQHGNKTLSGVKCNWDFKSTIPRINLEEDHQPQIYMIIYARLNFCSTELFYFKLANLLTEIKQTF